MKKSPLAEVKERFESKDKLVAAVRKLATGDLWLDRENEDGGLDLVSNKKLLHLHDLLTDVKKEFGSRAKLIAAIAELDKRTKDDGYKSRLESQSTPRLWDHYQASKKRSARAASDKKPGKKPTSKKAGGKKAGGGKAKAAAAEAQAG